MVPLVALDGAGALTERRPHYSNDFSSEKNGLGAYIVLSNGSDEIAVDTISAVTSGHLEIKTLRIYNRSAENHYFWINRTPVDSVSAQRLIRKYFWHKPERDYSFSFGGLMTDNIVFLDYNIYVGYNFIKLIEPDAYFDVMIPNNGALLKFYTERLVCLPQSVVIKYGCLVPDFFLYKENTLSLVELKSEEEKLLNLNGER